LLTIDDLQWVDELSLALCHYVIRATSTSARPLLSLATSRPSAAATAYASSLDRLLGSERSAVLELEPLGRDDGVRLIVGIAPTTDDRLAAGLWELAAGSPFWLDALARASNDDLDPADAVAQRLRGLPTDASAALAALTVAARPLTLEDLADLEDWPLSLAEHAATELIDRGLAVGTPGSVVLAHDIIRSTASRLLPDSAQRSLHRRFAEMLEAECWRRPPGPQDRA
jgi:predicted ATPase